VQKAAASTGLHPLAKSRQVRTMIDNRRMID
jgi:hypothetical protein